MSAQSTYENIEAYLNGTLAGDELKAFEEQLRSDQKLVAEVSLFRNIDDAVGDKPVLDFQRMVQEQGEAFLQKESAQEKAVPEINRFSRGWAIAAALLALVISATILWQIQSSTPLSTEALYAQNFETYKLNQSIRSGVTNDSAFKMGIRQYQAKDYTTAAQTFSPIAEADKSDMLVAFCLANAYMNQNPPQFDFAKREFQRIIDNGNSIYVLRAKWYLALIFIKEESPEKAEELLKTVAQSNDSLGTKAATLLKQL